MRRRPVVIRQHDPNDCGAAVLASVATYWGLRIPIALVRQYALTEREGTTALGIIKAAEELGFYAKGARILPDMLPDLPLPAIVHMFMMPGRRPHFVVLYRVQRERVLIGDPAEGLRWMPMEEFLAQWSGVVIILAPREEFRQADLGISPLRYVLRLLAPHRRRLAQATLGALLYTLLSLGSALYAGLLFDVVFPTGNLVLLHALGIAMLGTIALRALFGWVRSLLLFEIVQRVDAALVLGYFRHLLRLPQEFFDARRTGELLARVYDAVKVRNAIATAAVTLLVDATMLAVAFGLMWLLSPTLALGAMGMFPAYAAVVALLRRPMQRTQRALAERGAELQAHFTSTLSGIATVKAMTAEIAAQWRAEQGFVNIVRLLGRSLRQHLVASLSGELLGSLALLVVFWVGGALLLQGRLSMGELVAFSFLVSLLTQPLGRLLSLQQTLQDAVVAAERLFEILVLESEPQRHGRGIRLRAEQLRGEIEFRRCSFRYGFGNFVLRECSLHIPAGQITAIVGESGAGKTTLVRLLLKLYPLTEGAILLDGVDIRDLDTEWLRRVIGVVPQEIELFHGTVLENVAYGDLQPDRERVIQVCRRVGIDRMIAQLPARYDTLLGEHGVLLSGGQRQRLAIARALYRQPRVLVLDEATSNLDLATEELLLRLLEELRREGVTILLIAHRLSTVRIADRIAVLADGRIVEEGSHAELLQQQGVYASLWRRQLPLEGELQLYP
jgi:ABC-type bacteriocin transporter